MCVCVCVCVCVCACVCVCVCACMFMLLMVLCFKCLRTVVMGGLISFLVTSLQLSFRCVFFIELWLHHDQVVIEPCS